MVSDFDSAIVRVERSGRRMVLDLDSALQRLDGDRQLLREVIAMFLEDCPRLVEQIRSSLHNQDTTELRRSAHKLKGCVGYIGAYGVAQLSHRLECIAESGKLEDVPACFNELLTMLDDVVQTLRETPA